MQSTFQYLDADRNGYFDRVEFKNALNKLGKSNEYSFHCCMV